MAATRIINAQQGTGASASYPVNGHNTIRVQIWSGSATSTATVQIQTRSDDTNAPWFVEATITNPTGAGVDGTGSAYWVIPTAGQLRVVVSAWTAGAINVNLERYNQWRA